MFDFHKYLLLVRWAFRFLCEMSIIVRIYVIKLHESLFRGSQVIACAPTDVAKEVGEFVHDNILKKNRWMEDKIQVRTGRSGCLLPHVITHKYWDTVV
jgi:hypothetical protein